MHLDPKTKYQTNHDTYQERKGEKIVNPKLQTNKKKQHRRQQQLRMTRFRPDPLQNDSAFLFYIKKKVERKKFFSIRPIQFFLSFQLSHVTFIRSDVGTYLSNFHSEKLLLLASYVFMYSVIDFGEKKEHKNYV